MTDAKGRRAISYPTNRLMAVFDDPAQAAAPLAELKAGGLPARDLEILRGPEGADRMDGTGRSGAGSVESVVGSISTLMDQLVDFAHCEAALRDGRGVVMVRVAGNERKAAALDILRRHGGHFINHYGRFATEELDLWRGPERDVSDLLRR